MKECNFIKGMDISTLLELEGLGAAYYHNGEKSDFIQILKEHGVNFLRLRLWNDPYSKEGAPYGAGTNDLATTVALAKRGKRAGMQILLDFQYSDFWADPGKQVIPKAWTGFSFEQLTDAVFSYTRDTLFYMQKEQVLPDMVQVGNELTNGLLWPMGKRPDFEHMAQLISAGIKGVNSVSKEISVMLHLDNGGNIEMYREWFDNFMQRKEKNIDFDVIGLSYYPFWHGTMDMLAENMNMLAHRYHKKLVIAETSTGFTTEDYAQYEKLLPKDRKGMATKPQLLENLEYAMTREGQCLFLKELINRITAVPDNLGWGYFYWEPGWIPIYGSGWANKAALAYTKEDGPGGNEWANQALFDYDGNTLPALEVVRDYP